MPIRADDRRPPYRQLADELREAIETGDYRPGQALPSTRQLMESHGLASLTVQRAIGVLRDEGIVVSEPGRGVFVNDPAQAPAPASDRSRTPRTLDEALKMLDELNERLDRLEARTTASPSEPAAGPEPEPDRAPEIEP